MVPSRRCRTKLVLVLLLSSAIVLWWNHPDRNSARCCFANRQRFYWGQPTLEDVLLSGRKPTPGQTIFFHETRCHRPHRPGEERAAFGLFGWMEPALIRLSARQACAIESAARHHSDHDVFVLFASGVLSADGSRDPLLSAVLAYPNVHLRNVNIWSYAADSPVHDWLTHGQLFTSRYLRWHIADLLRFLTLWRWGGTYLDMDVVVQRSLADVAPNFSGAESDRAVAIGVMNFSPGGVGHEVAELCLHGFRDHFDGDNWGHNGPGLLTRVLQQVCRTDNISAMSRARCRGFEVLPPEAFYAVPWPRWSEFFEAEWLEETLNRTRASYVVHVWNKFSRQRRLEAGANAAYAKIAEQHCPRTFAASGDHF